MNDHTKIKKHSKELLRKLGFDAEPIVTQQEEIIFVNLQIDSPGLLIGRGGEGLEALQHILRLLISRDEEIFSTNIIIDIAGYRDKKIESVKKLAHDKAYLVLSTGIEEILPEMSSYERRIVHMVCTNIADIETESTGEGRERKVIIKPKKV
jgi:spoIIIJ-associated protein